MALWGFLVFSGCGTAFGLWSINRDFSRGRVEGRGFGFDRATQPLGYYALMTFNIIATALLFVVTVVLAAALLRHSPAG